MNRRYLLAMIAIQAIVLFHPCQSSASSIGTIIRKVEAELPIVVIDPGHGGKDPGAVGKNGTIEKEINLKVAKLAAMMLESDGKIKAVLTRKEDAYLTLAERVEIARKNNARAFVSIHCDWSENKQARGGSIFVLNEKGASDNAARILAERENSVMQKYEDISSSNPHVTTILVSMRQTHNINESSRLASLVIPEFERLSRVASRGMRFAPFAVLKTYDIPAILCEIGFLSNSDDEALMNRRSFQVSAAWGISNGIRKFLGIEPRPVAINGVDVDVLEYSVRKGDTIWDLSTQFCIPVDRILEINRLDNRQARIRIGQKLLIPSS